MAHVRKAWSGGKRPALTTEDKAFLAHASNCPKCADAGWMFGKCEEGARLYKAIRYDSPACACEATTAGVDSTMCRLHSEPPTEGN